MGGRGHNSMRSITEVYDSTLLVLGGGKCCITDEWPIKRYQKIFKMIGELKAIYSVEIQREQNKLSILT